MNVIAAWMKGIMLVAGLLTCSMLYVALAPQAALQSMFGPTIANFGGPIVDVVARSWGVLITLVGAMLIYGAFHVASRPLVLTVAGLSKLVYIALMLTFGRPFLAGKGLVPFVVDSVLVVLFALYLLRPAPR